MAITLSQLCENTDENYSMKLIAGKNGLKNTVRWVHIVEDSEVPDFLHGNELIFTTGIGHAGNEWLREFILSLHKKGAVGLVVNIGPHITAVPPQVIVYCEQNDLPLFTIPWKTRIIDITYDFCRKIIANEKRESTISDAFKDIIRRPEKINEHLPVLRHAGFNEQSNYIVITVEFFREHSSVTESVVKAMDMSLWKSLRSGKNQSILFVHRGVLTAIRQNCSDSDIRGFCSLVRMITDNSDNICCCIGISDRASGLAEVSAAYFQSKAARMTARIYNRECCCYSDIGIMKLLAAVSNKSVLEAFEQEQLGILRQHDEQRHTDYFETLRKYLEANCSVNELAEATGVHRNTVNHKIRMIKQLLGSDLTNEDKARLIIAYHISDMLKYNNHSDGGN
ncbi:MAG: PucR family transcriptional regulator ligand-binding domain-containing protein [Clostridia bacterium]|nr:PucR family transcriptional regulator ligand-binding domain-containing protein [Clostridia bacterium]